MAEFMDPYVGSQQHTDDSKRRALDAVAQAGTAGLKAFQEAQAGIQQNQHAALQRAQQGASMFGVDPSAFGSNTTQDRFAMQQGHLASSQADMQAHNAHMGAANTSYFEKVNAALGALKEQNASKGGEYEAQLKAFIAKKEQEAAAAAAAAQADRDHDLRMLGIREQGENDRARLREQGESDRAKQAKVGNITLDQLMGAATQQRKANPIQADTGNILASTVEGSKALAGDLTSRAMNIGNMLGMDPMKLMGLNDPGFQKNLLADLGYKETTDKLVPASFDKNWLLGTFLNYDGNKISSKRADEVLRAPEVPLANNMVGILAGARIENGRLVDDDPALAAGKGMTPKDYFWQWVSEQPGIKTMKTALLGYYTPFLESLSR